MCACGPQDPRRAPAALLAALTLAFPLAQGACSRHNREAQGRTAPPARARDVDASATARAGQAVDPASARALPEAPEPPPARGAWYGGSLRLHLDVEPPHLDPLADSHAVVQRVVSGLVYESLLECTGSAYHPGLAAGWDVSQDGERVTVKLRPGARFHDGRLASGVDVQATFETLLRANSRSPVLHAMLEDVESVEVLAEGARFRLRRPSDLVLRALCEIPILPAEPLRKGGLAVAQLARQPVGTGPYRMAVWERGKRIRLVRAQPASPPQPPYLDEIVFEIDSDGARALVRTRRGEIDILPRVLEAHYPEQVAPATLRGSLDVFWLKPDRYSFIVPNHRRGPLADARVRRGLSLLWDRARFADQFHRGTAQPIGAPTFGQVGPDPFSREQAAALFEQAGLRDSDGDGVRDVGGAALRLTFLVPSGARTLAAEVKAYTLDVHRSGILLDTSVVDAASLRTRLQQGDFDLAALTWEGARDEDARVLAGSVGPLALAGHRSDELQALLDGLRAPAGPAARAPALQRIAELMAREAPLIFLYRHCVPALVSRRVHGLAGVGDRLDLRRVWVDP